MTWILMDWPYAGLVLAVGLLLWLLLERRGEGAGPRWRDPAFVLALLWPMYLVHQFEEHGIDALGRPYAFLDALCGTLGHGPGESCPADPSFIFAVNVGACWLAFACAVVFRRSHPLIAACAWGIPLVNAVAHIAPSIARGAYNPGLLTSIALFLPMCALMLRVLLGAGLMRPRQIVWVVLAGVLTHAVLLGSLQLRARGLPQPALLAINGLNGLWPIALGLLAARVGRPMASSVDRSSSR